MTNLLNIATVAQENVPADKLQIIARFKDTEKRPISAANRIRAVLLSANIWSDNINHPENNNAFRAFIHDAVEELAKTYLATITEESNWQRKEVPAEDFNLANLLQWQQQRSELSARLNGDAIKQWAEQSKTIANITASHSKQHADALVSQFVKLASPNHGLDATKAGNIISKLFAAEDTEHMIGARILLKLEAIRDKPANSDDLLGSLF